MRIGIALSFAACLTLGCSSPATESDARVGSSRAAVTAVSGDAIAKLALSNVGQGACTTNSLGGTHFESSCTGNGGQPEYWCADFAIWVWASLGADVSGLTAAAGSFYVYGQNNGTLSNTPAVGDAVVFDYQGGGVANHVAIVTSVNGDGTIESVSGDWGGQSGSEAYFSSTSSVVLNAPAYSPSVGSTPSVMGMTISGFISPLGLTASSSYAAAYVSQSFPLASSALTMTAGQTIPSYIELKNAGSAAWDSATHLGTTQPRDRASVFADGTWLAANRPAAVSGTVPVGGTYKFTFNLHAPSTPGTYFEYFNLVQDGVAWFSDPGQGGPPDNDLEVQIVVLAAPETLEDAGAKGPAEDAGAEGDAGQPAAKDAGSLGQVDGGPPKAPMVTRDAGVGPAYDAGAGEGLAASNDQGTLGTSSGCAVTRAPVDRAGLAWLVAIGAACAIARRRRLSGEWTGRRVNQARATVK